MTNVELELNDRLAPARQRYWSRLVKLLRDPWPPRVREPGRSPEPLASVDAHSPAFAIQAAGLGAGSLLFRCISQSKTLVLEQPPEKYGCAIFSDDANSDVMSDLDQRIARVRLRIAESRDLVDRQRERVSTSGSDAFGLLKTFEDALSIFEQRLARLIEKQNQRQN